MSEVPSTFQLEPGSTAPEFSLPAADGERHSLSELSANRSATVIAFVCNHCPFVVHLADAMARIADDYASRGVQFIAINSNDVENYPADAPDKMTEFAREHGWTFPYLFDESQEVAKAYSAACTPDFFVFDSSGRLAYAGQFDSTRPKGEGEVTGEDIRSALDQLLSSGQGPDQPWQPSSGCNIKWKAGNAPAYF